MGTHLYRSCLSTHGPQQVSTAPQEEPQLMTSSPAICPLPGDIIRGSVAPPPPPPEVLTPHQCVLSREHFRAGI